MPNRIPKRELNDFFKMKSPTPKTLNPTKWVVRAHLFLLVRLIEQLTDWPMYGQGNLFKLN